MDVAALLISLASLGIAFAVVRRDRTRRQIDMLCDARQRIWEAAGRKPEANIEESMEMQENDPDDPRVLDFKSRSTSIQDAIERELEFACLLALKRQINIELFFYSFRSWLSWREMIWRQGHSHHLARSHPFTIKVINMCIRKKLLPLQDNEDLARAQKEVDVFLANKSMNSATDFRSREESTVRVNDDTKKE